MAADTMTLSDVVDDQGYAYAQATNELAPLIESLREPIEDVVERHFETGRHGWSARACGTAVWMEVRAAISAHPMECGVTLSDGGQCTRLALHDGVHQ